MDYKLIKRHFEKEARGNGPGGKCILFGEEHRVALSDGFTLIWVSRYAGVNGGVDVFQDRAAYPTVPADREAIANFNNGGWNPLKVNYNQIIPTTRNPARFTAWLKESALDDQMRMFRLADDSNMAVNRRYTDMLAKTVAESLAYKWYAGSASSPLLVTDGADQVLAVMMPMNLDANRGDIATCLCQLPAPEMPKLPIDETATEHPAETCAA